MPPSELSEPSDSEEPSDCEEKWSDNDEVDNELLVEDDSEPEEEIQFVGISPTAKVLARWLTLFLMQIHSQYKVPESAVSRLFSFLFTYFVSWVLYIHFAVILLKYFQEVCTVLN